MDLGSELPPLTPPPGHWQRLHAALMPDYNPRATLFWWSVVVLGAFTLVGCLGALSGLPLVGWLQTLAAIVLAMLAGLFPLRVPGTKNSFVAGEIFIFLLLLVQGPEAAVVATAVETFMGSIRTSARWTSRIISPCVAALAMGSCGWLLTAAVARWGLSGWADAAPLLAVMMVFATGYLLVSVTLLGGVIRLKREQPFFNGLEMLSVHRWVGIAYTGSAAMASLLYVGYRQSGVGVLMVMLPLLGMLLVSLHFYFRQQEATEAMREVNAEMAAREAVLAARESEASQRHWQELQASERRFHAAFTHASIGMALMAFDGRLLQANPMLAALLGLRDGDLAERALQDFVTDDDRAALNTQLGLLPGREFEPFRRELRLRHHDGSEVWADLHCSFFTEPGAVKPCLILQAQDVTARRHAEAGLHHLAFTDGLTGLPNRRRFIECLDGAVQRCQADASQAFAVVFLDFDRFKLVNDSLGHSAGDRLLALLARRLQENLRPGDVVARLGGDEFAILAEHASTPHDAIVLAERLIAALRQPFTLDDIQIVSSASIGITFSSFGYDSGEAVLRDADTAMYKAKDAGKAGYVLFDASLHHAVAERLRLEGELRLAVAAGQLVLVYQPLIELASGRLTSFEALVRWNHPADGTINPASFLAIAAETGQMPQLSDFVLHCACRQLRQWQLSSPALEALSISVNISASDLAHEAFVARVSRAIVESGLRPQHLTLELTEDILMARAGTPAGTSAGTSADVAVRTLHELRNLGVRLAVDDFGTGYSSLSQLSKLPIDSLKIDGSFVSSLQRDSDAAVVVQTIIQLGGSLHKSVIAEGIESADQLQQLREMGCLFGQGYHLAAPMTTLEASALLQRQGAPLH